MNTSAGLAYWCEAAGQLNFSTLYIWQDLLKAALNSMSFFFILFMFARRLLWIHDQIHGLIGFKLFIVSIYALNNSITHWMVVTCRLFSTDPCNCVFLSKDCLQFNIIQRCCMLSMSTTIFLLLLERTLSLHPRITERLCQAVTRAFIILEILVFLLVTLKSIEFEYGQEWMILHCLEDTKTIRPLGEAVSVAIICIDVPSMIYCVLLRLYSIRNIRRRHQSLSLSYRVRYSLTVIDAFIPVIFFHGAVLLFNNIITLLSPIILPNPDLVTKKNWNGLTNIMPYYTVLMPLLYLGALKKIRERRDREFLGTRQPRINGKVIPDGDLYHLTNRAAWETQGYGKKEKKGMRFV